MISKDETNKNGCGYIELKNFRTPNGGIKKSRQQRKEELFKKKRAKSALKKKVMSVDLGFYPLDTESSDEDIFTENVWWEAAENIGFVADNEESDTKQACMPNGETEQDHEKEEKNVKTDELDDQ